MTDKSAPEFFEDKNEALSRGKLCFEKIKNSLANHFNSEDACGFFVLSLFLNGQPVSLEKANILSAISGFSEDKIIKVLSDPKLQGDDFLFVSGITELFSGDENNAFSELSDIINLYS